MTPAEYNSVVSEIRGALDRGDLDRVRGLVANVLPRIPPEHGVYGDGSLFTAEPPNEVA